MRHTSSHYHWDIQRNIIISIENRKDMRKANKAKKKLLKYAQVSDTNPILPWLFSQMFYFSLWKIVFLLFIPSFLLNLPSLTPSLPALCVLSCLRFCFIVVVIVIHQSSELFFPFNSYSLCFMLAWMYEQLQSYREQWLMSNKWGKRPHTQFYSTTHKLMPTCHTRWQKYSFLIQTYTHGWWWWKKNFLWQIYEAFTMTKLVNDVSHKGGWMMKTPCYTHSIASGLWGGRK